MGDIVRDISELSFAEVCKACMTKDKDVSVTLILHSGKKTKKTIRKAIEWINLGSSRNVSCKTLHISEAGTYTVKAESR